MKTDWHGNSLCVYVCRNGRKRNEIDDVCQDRVRRERECVGSIEPVGYSPMPTPLHKHHQWANGLYKDERNVCVSVVFGWQEKRKNGWRKVFPSLIHCSWKSIRYFFLFLFFQCRNRMKKFIKLVAKHQQVLKNNGPPYISILYLYVHTHRGSIYYLFSFPIFSPVEGFYYSFGVTRCREVADGVCVYIYIQSSKPCLHTHKVTQPENSRKEFFFPFIYCYGRHRRNI